MAEDRRLTLVVLVDTPPDAVAAFRRYEDAVLPLLSAHGGRVERRLRSTDGLSEVHVLSFGFRDGFEAFRTDPARVAAQHLPAGVTVSQRVLEVDDVPSRVPVQPLAAGPGSVL
jgi:hypothetical protein